MNIDLMPLIDLKEGEKGVVHYINGGYSLISRLASMGIAPGIQISVLRNSGGPLLLLSNGTRIALGKGQSSKIIVKKLKKKSDKSE